MLCERLSRRRQACLTLFISLPLDHLWRHIQYIEEHGAALLDLVCPRLNAFVMANKSYWEMCNTHVMAGPLGPYFWHFGDPSRAGHNALLQEVRFVLLHQAAHLWHRLVVPLAGYPFRLLQIVDDRLPLPVREQCAEELFSTPRCCLDPDFSLKVCMFSITNSRFARTSAPQHKYYFKYINRYMSVKELCPCNI